jgi:hypothetical protein
VTIEQPAGASRISNKPIKSNKPVKRFAVWLNPRVALIIDPAAPLKDGCSVVVYRDGAAWAAGKVLPGRGKSDRITIRTSAEYSPDSRPTLLRVPRANCIRAVAWYRPV